MALAFLSNDDIFISYSRRDAACAKYARNLYDALSKRGFSPFMDRLGTEPSRIQPESLNRKIRKSKMLVLIGTERACQSEFVEKEINEFVLARRLPIVPIDFTGAIPNARWYSLVEGVTIESETAHALESGNPSGDVIARIEEAFKYTKRNDQLHKATRITVGVLSVLILLSIGAAVFAARQMKEAAGSRRAAVEAKTAADSAKKEAADEISKAAQTVSEANKKAADADTQRITAEAKSQAAQEQELLAEAKTRQADEETRKATVAAARQKEITSAMDLATKSRQIFLRQPDNLTQSVSYAMDSMRIVTSLGLKSLESDAALRESLALLPAHYPGHVYESVAAVDAALSPDARYLSILTANKSLNIFRTEDHVLVKELPSETLPAEAFSSAITNDARYVAVVSVKAIKLFDLQTGKNKVFQVSHEGVSFDRIALSPDARFLAVLLDDGDAEDMIRTVGLWETKNEQTMFSLGDHLNMPMNSIAFSPDGDTLAIGGRAFTANRGDVGRAVFWRGLSALTREPITEKTFDETQIELHDSEVEAIAVGTRNLYAIITSNYATVWKLEDLGEGITPVARLPRTSDLQTLAFNADATQLSIVKAARVDDSNEQRRISLDVWDSTGHPRASEAWLETPVEGVAFRPDNRSILTTLDGGNHLQVWQAEDGHELKADGLSTVDKHVLFKSRDLRFLAATENEQLFVWDGWRSARISIQSDGDRCLTPKAASITTDGSFLAATCQDNQAIVYQLVRGAYVRNSVFPVSDKIASIEVTPDGSLLIAKHSDDTLHILDAASGTERTHQSIKQLKDVDAIMLSPGGAYLVTAFSFDSQLDNNERPPRLTVWRVSDGLRIKDLRARQYSFSPKDRYFLSAEKANEIAVLDLRKGNDTNIRVASTRLDSWVDAVAFSPNEQYFATGTSDGGVSVFVVETKAEVVRLQLDGAVRAIAFNQKNNYLATAIERPDPHDLTPDDDHALQIWEIQPQSLMDEATRRMNSLAKTK
jgi:WD40 repeat protein